MDEEEDYPACLSDVEVDSDHDDQDAERQLGDWLEQLDALRMGVDPGDRSTVKRRNKTVVTPKMAMESFRLSFLNSEEPQDVNLDAILGELCELESQLTTTQSELSQTLGRNFSMNNGKDDNRDSGNDFIQSELDALAAEIQMATGPHFLAVGDVGFDIGEADSAFSDNTSLPSSESFTSMVTVSSSADTSSSASGETASTNSTSTLTAPSFPPQTEEHVSRVRARLDRVREDLARTSLSPEEQKARLKAEKIRIALEKIKEAKIRKLFVRAFTPDGSSKSILVDEKMTVGQVCSVLAEKNHMRLTDQLTVLEHLPELYMERILEDHDSLVESMVMWTRDSKNKILYENRTEKYDLFRNPEKYLLVGSSSEKGTSLDPSKRHTLLQEFFSGTGVQIPEVEGVLYLKSDGKKAWKKFFFVLRGSGLYYNPKGKMSKSSRDLSCLIQFDLIEVYKGLAWKKKYHAPTDYCFALKHPQIQKKTSKYMRYLCAENKASMEMWMTGIRIAKCGKQLLDNYDRMRYEVEYWDRREPWTNQMMDTENEDDLQPSAFNRDDLHDSRFSVPEPDRHSIITVTNCSIASSTDLDDGIFMMDGMSTIQRSPNNLHQNGTESPQKTPVKRVSFSTTHCIINADSCELTHLRHRDSITSASTDTSDESTSSGEGGRSPHPRGKMRAKIPVTTETTRQISGMVQLAMENSSVSSVEGAVLERKCSVSSCGSSSYGSSGNNEKATLERRKSAPQLHSPSNSSGRERNIDAKPGLPCHKISAPVVQHPLLPVVPTVPHSAPVVDNINAMISNPLPPNVSYNMVNHNMHNSATAPRSSGTQSHQKHPSLSSLQGDLRQSPPRSPVLVTPPVPPATLPGVPMTQARKSQSGVNIMSCPPIKTPPRAPTPPRTSTPAGGQATPPPTPPKSGHARRTSGGGPVPVAPPTPPIQPIGLVQPRTAQNGYADAKDYGVTSAGRASVGVPPPPPGGMRIHVSTTIPPPPSVLASMSIYSRPSGSVPPQSPVYSGIPPSPSQMMAANIPMMMSPNHIYGEIPSSPGQYSGGMPSPPNRSSMGVPPTPPSQMSAAIPPPPCQMYSVVHPAQTNSIPPPPASKSMAGRSPLATMEPNHGLPPPLPPPNPTNHPPPVAAKPQGPPPAVARKPSSRPQQYSVPTVPAAPEQSCDQCQISEDILLSPGRQSASGLPLHAELAQQSSKQPNGAVVNCNAAANTSAEQKAKMQHDSSPPSNPTTTMQESSETSTSSLDFNSSHYAQIRAGIAKHFESQKGTTATESLSGSMNRTVKQPVPPPVSVPPSPSAPPSVANKPRSEPAKVANPPPPPRRSESTRLSTRGSKGKGLPQQPESPVTENVPVSCVTTCGTSINNQDSLPPVEHDLQRLPQHLKMRRESSPKFDGILPIEDLPPPPPELLEGLPGSPGTMTGLSGKKPKPPPPPPKRNKDTQLSNS